MNKAGLLQRMREGRAEWDALLAEVPAERLREPGVVGHWSVADVVAHLTAYERWVAGWLTATLQNRQATTQELYLRDEVPEGVEDLPEDDYNAWVVAEAANVPPEELLARSRDAHAALVAAVEACPEEALHDAGRWESSEGRSVAEIIPGQCFGHYAGHAPDLRAWLSAGT
jgi:hypothetical protein